MKRNINQAPSLALSLLLLATSGTPSNAVAKTNTECLGFTTGESRTLPKDCIVVGDVVVDNIPQYDNGAGESTIVVPGAFVTTTIKSEFGAGSAPKTNLEKTISDELAQTGVITTVRLVETNSTGEPSVNYFKVAEYPEAQSDILTSPTCPEIKADETRVLSPGQTALGDMIQITATDNISSQLVTGPGYTGTVQGFVNNLTNPITITTPYGAGCLESTRGKSIARQVFDTNASADKIRLAKATRPGRSKDVYGRPEAYQPDWRRTMLPLVRRG